MVNLNAVDTPLKFRRGAGLVWDGSSRCPYCLEKLGTLHDDPSASFAKPPLGPPSWSVPGLGTTKACPPTGGSGDRCLCPLCRHDIPSTIRGVPPHALNRPQEWDYLNNEMGYRLIGERRDVESYIFAMGEHWNPDYKDAKDRYMGMLCEREALWNIREELLEAEGDLETLILQYLRKKSRGESGLAGLILSGEKWRQWARGLSAEGAGPRLIAEFQLDYVGNLFWGLFESTRLYNDTIRYLKDRLDQLGPA